MAFETLFNSIELRRIFTVPALVDVYFLQHGITLKRLVGSVFVTDPMTR